MPGGLSAWSASTLGPLCAELGIGLCGECVVPGRLLTERVGIQLFFPLSPFILCLPPVGVVWVPPASRSPLSSLVLPSGPLRCGLRVLCGQVPSLSPRSFLTGNVLVHDGNAGEDSFVENVRCFKMLCVN